MINNSTPLSMAEASEYIKEASGDTDVKGFIKKFSKTKPAKAKALRKKLEGLDLMKMKLTHVAKIIDILPTDKEELNKIFTDVSLDEDETNKILESVKEYI
ncbi:hypothetical protein ACFLZJ_00890 [Nanoarchaeota archaeon]